MLMILLLAAGGVWLYQQSTGHASTGGTVGTPSNSDFGARASQAFGGQSPVPRAWQDDARRPDVINAVQGWAVSLGLNPAWVAAHCKVESAWNPAAVNPADPSYGLMQVTPLIARAYGGWDGKNVEDIKRLDINVRAGATFLKHLLSRYGQLELAIQAYNLGEPKVDRGLRVPDYLNKVLAAYRTYGGPV